VGGVRVREEVYKVTCNEPHDVYLIVSALDIIGAVRAVMGAQVIPDLIEGGLSFGQSRNCLVRGTPFEIEFRLTGWKSAEQADRVMESIVRELEARQPDALDWATIDESRRRLVTAS